MVVLLVVSCLVKPNIEEFFISRSTRGDQKVQRLFDFRGDGSSESGEIRSIVLSLFFLDKALYSAYQ